MATKVVKEKELRTFAVKELRVRRDAGKAPVIEGYASVFNKNSLDLGGFVERVASGAFTNTLAKNPDVRALIDHESGKVLGRTKSNTLRLTQDDNGLRVEIDAPDTSFARDLMASMDRGDIDQMSFGFWTVSDSWADVNGQVIRTLLEVDIDGGDVSVVTFPAYPDTSVAVREMRTWQGKRSKGDDNPMMAAMKPMMDGMNKVDLTGDADHDFSALMIPHHDGAIAMAHAELAHGKDTGIRAMAKEIISSQEKQVEQLKAFLSSSDRSHQADSTATGMSAQELRQRRAEIAM